MTTVTTAFVLGGGGILGAVRGDIYWGDDAIAEDLGGRMGGEGKYWLLLPKGVTK